MIARVAAVPGPAYNPNPRAVNEPLSELYLALIDHGRPPLSWVVAHAPGGDLQPLWERCRVPHPMVRMLALVRADLSAVTRVLAPFGVCDVFSGGQVPELVVDPEAYREACASAGSGHAMRARMAAAIRTVAPTPPRLAELIEATQCLPTRSRSC